MLMNDMAKKETEKRNNDTAMILTSPIRSMRYPERYEHAATNGRRIKPATLMIIGLPESSLMYQNCQYIWKAQKDLRNKQRLNMNM